MEFPNGDNKPFSGAVAGDLEALARGVSHILSLYFVIVLPNIFFVSLVLPFVCFKTEKYKKKLKIPAPCLIRFYLVIMTSPSDITSLGEILTFVQKVGESFKNAWEKFQNLTRKCSPELN